MNILSLKENMVYNNLLSRTLTSIILLFSYLFFSFFYFENIIYLIIIVYLIIVLEIAIFFNKYKLLSFLYIGLSFIFLFNINFSIDYYYKFNLLIIIIITFDSCSYFFGKLLGKNKIFSYVSPKKTYEGLIGGFLFSLLTGLLFCYIFDIIISLNLFLFFFFIIFSSFIGDVIESVLKRLNNLKNSSNFIPGHGGFFDRFDSFVLALTVYSFVVNLIWKLIFMEVLVKLEKNHLI